jgi:uncharacterized protein
MVDYKKILKPQGICKMKTKEEIEKLAEKEYREYPNTPLDEPAWHYNKDIHCHKKRKAFIKGYTQCQQDMDDKIKEAYEQGLKDGYACMPSINSLNKQD